jgi:biopolymer transport protein ExbD
MKSLLIIIGLVFTITLTSCTSRIAVQSPKYTVVKVAPKHHKIVIIKGKRYYYWNGRHYKRTKKGYIPVRV